MTIYESFSAPIGTHGNALLNWRGATPKEIIAYAVAYRSAAMNLVGIKEQQDIVHAIDDDALPILFLYRHSFELYLKSIIYQVATLSIDESELVNAVPRLWREHSLVALVNISESILLSPSTRSPVQSRRLHSDIRELAENLDDVDPGSYAFRYPVTTKGTSCLPSHFFTNIFVFSEAMEHALDDLARFFRSLKSERAEASDKQ